MSQSDHTIAESELILNSNGSIYHLNLRPEDIADTIITVGDPDRVVAVSQHFDEIELKAQRREFITHTGYFNKKRLTVISTGIGTPSIDIVLNELDALVNIDLETRTVKPHLKSLDIIRIGTAGGLQPDIPVDSFVLSEYAIGLEAALRFYPMENSPEELAILKAFNDHMDNTGFSIHPYVCAIAPQFKELFKKDCIAGMTVTCGGFYAAQGRVLRSPVLIPDLLERLQAFNHNGQRILNFEMETAAIYGLSKVFNHRCCSVSLVLTNRAEKNFSKIPTQSMDRLIGLVLDRITSQ